jgi:hypothetical protein
MKLHTLTSLGLLGLLSLSVACSGGESEKETGGEDGADGADGADGTDSGTGDGTDGTDGTDGSDGSDGGTDLPAGTISGTTHLFTSANGETGCDVSTTYTGSTLSGSCEGCDWGFKVDATISEDASTEDCVYYPQLTFLPSGATTDIYLAHADEYTVYGYYDDYVYTDVLLWGYGINYYTYYYPGPYWSFFISSGESPYGTFSRTGDDISWSFYIAYDDTAYYANYYTYCSSVYGTAGTSNYGGAYTGTSTVDCGYYGGDEPVIDVWSMMATVGDTVSVTVDTVADDTAFDTLLWVNDGDSCTVAYADDSFDCTYTPAAYQCSSVQFDATTETYELVVASYGSCNGDEAEYQLSVDAASNPMLALSQDSIPRYTEVTTPRVIDAEGTGTMVFE